MAKTIIRKKLGYVVVHGYDETRWDHYNEAFEYRSVVEEYIGCSVPQDSVVHYIDRVRDRTTIEPDPDKQETL